MLPGNRNLPAPTPIPTQRPRGAHLVMESVVGADHTDQWSPWYTCGDTIDQWILVVYANDVLVQFAPLEQEHKAAPPIKRRVGETGRDRQAVIGIGMVRVRSLTPGSNGTFDLELYA